MNRHGTKSGVWTMPDGTSRIGGNGTKPNLPAPENPGDGLFTGLAQFPGPSTGHST